MGTKRKCLIAVLIIISAVGLTACGQAGKSAETVSVSDTVTDEHVIYRFYEAYDNLPEWVRESFSENGWTVCLCDGLSEAYGFEINGLTVYDDKTVYISADDFGTSKHVMCHEFGHYSDHILNQPSQTEEFSEIYESEYPEYRDNICSDKHISESSSEYWADCCFYYWALPEKLKEFCPDTFAYTDGIMTEYCGSETEPIAYN